MPTIEQLKEMERALARGKALDGMFFKLVFEDDAEKLMEIDGFEEHSERSHKSHHAYYVEVDWLNRAIVKLRKRGKL